MRDVLVTGSRGFIGQHLIAKLQEDDRIRTIVGIGRYGGDHLLRAKGLLRSKQVELDVDITKTNEVRKLFDIYKPHIIFHLAANPLTKLDEYNPTDVTTVNVIGTQNLLHYCEFTPRFVFASSATVYGETDRYVPENAELKPTSVYGASKVAAECLVNAYTNMGRVSGVRLRYVANVGRGATHGVLPDVVRKLRSDNPNLELFGNDPGTEKPYMHVTDTVGSTIYIGIDSIYTGPINIAPNNSITIKELAFTTMRTLNIGKPIKWLGSATIWPGDNMKVLLNNYKLCDIGGTKWINSSQIAIEKAVREL